MTMASTLDRLTYAARQTARVAWYAGHYAAGRRLLKPMPKPDFPGRADALARRDDGRHARRVRARMAGHRRRPVSRRRARLATGARPSSCAAACSISATCRRSTRAATAHERRAAARRAGRRPARLLSPELPLPERRLAQRAFGRDLRHPGRGAVHRRRRRHAPPRAASRSPSGWPAATSATSRASMSAAAPAGCSPSCTMPGPACASPASISARPISPRRAA